MNLFYFYKIVVISKIYHLNFPPFSYCEGWRYEHGHEQLFQSLLASFLGTEPEVELLDCKAFLDLNFWKNSRAR